ncbi:MAG: hypothetical protein N2690_10680, partial [Rhodocyclaceae bacterium]|nr:hypothetical protein [Rhodocyclaceae bacterium]
PYGFPALGGKLALFFLAVLWLIINHADAQARDYPLVRIKYGLLLAAIPLFATSFWLELRYFLALKADVITSCCGSLFSSDTPALANELAALPPRPALAVFYGALVCACALLLRHARRRDDLSGYLAALGTLAAFLASLTGILAFVSLYIYEHPHHHCPFCLLKPDYDYQGYALYLPLFAAAAAGLGAGVLRLFSRRPSLTGIIAAFSARLAAFAAASYALFALLATLMIWRSNLILLD